MKLNISKALKSFPKQLAKPENKKVTKMKIMLGKAAKSFPKKLDKQLINDSGNNN